MNCKLLKRISTGLVVCILVLLVVGLQTRPGFAQEKNGNGQEPYRIGLIPEQNIFDQKKRYEPLLTYLSDTIGIPVEIVILPRYGNIIDNFNALELDGAFFGSFTGAMAIKKLEVEPIARPRYKGGASTYYGMVFVRKDSKIRDAADMKDKKMVFVDKATTAGFLLPLSYFKKLGIDDYKSWFSEYYFSGTHEDAILDVLKSKADVGAAKNTVFYRLATHNKKIINDLKILETSPHVPSNGLALRKDFDPALKQKLQDTLLNMADTERGLSILQDMNIETFIETTVEDYSPVMEYAESIGMDLALYEYLND